MLKTFEVPVPHDNKTGDVEYMENYIFKNQFWQKVSLRVQSTKASKVRKLLVNLNASIFKSEQTLYLNLAKDAIKISCLAFVAWKTYRTNGEWLQSKFDFISEKVKPFIKS